MSTEALFEQTRDHQLERVMLGLMMCEEGPALDQGMDLTAEDFSLQSHKRLLSLIQSMNHMGEAVNLQTVSAEVRSQLLSEQIGGVAYLLEIMEGLPRGAGALQYIRRLREKTSLRRVLAAVDIAKDRISQGDSAAEILAEIGSSAHTAQMLATQIKPAHIADFIAPTLEQMMTQRNHQETVLGVASGIASLDRVTTGFRPGELTYVGALPGRGKTSFLLQTMYHAASTGTPVGCISLEMRAGQLVRRLAILKSKLDSNKMRDPRTLNASEWRLAQESTNALASLPIHLNDQSGLRPGQIASLARQMHERGARILFVDFVQIIHEEGKDRREAINRVSASLRDTCKALEVPFIVASQLARRDADPNRLPTLQDLRESGNLEQDAHNVLLLHRPKDKRTGEWTGEDVILVEKQREGVTGGVDVRYNGDLMVYEDRRPDYV